MAKKRQTLDILKRVFIIACCLVTMYVMPVRAITQDDINSMLQGTEWYDPTSGCMGSSGSASSNATNQNRDKNIAQAFAYFVGQGLTPQAAAGILGNFDKESGVDPTSQEDGSKDPNPKDGVGFGIAQWTFTSRQQPIVDLAKKNNKAPTDFGIQLEYVMQELHGGFKDAFNAIQAAPDASQAAFQFHKIYEVSADPPSKIQGRMDDASAIYQRYKNTSPASSVADGGSGAPTPDCSTGSIAGTVGNCTNNGDMTGIAAILSCAQEFDPYGYVWGGGHEDPETYMKTFMSQGGFNNKFRGTVDCSGLINVSVWNAYHVKLGGGWVASDSSATGSGQFRQISKSEILPGDILMRSGEHVGVATKAGDDAANFAAHTENAPSADQIGPSNAPGEFHTYFRYIGKGSH